MSIKSTTLCRSSLFFVIHFRTLSIRLFFSIANSLFHFGPLQGSPLRGGGTGPGDAFRDTPCRPHKYTIRPISNSHQGFQTGRDAASECGAKRGRKWPSFCERFSENIQPSVSDLSAGATASRGFQNPCRDDQGSVHGEAAFRRRDEARKPDQFATQSNLWGISP